MERQRVTIIRADKTPAFWATDAPPRRILESEIKADVLVELNAIDGVWAANHPTGVGLSMDGARVIRFGIVGSGDILASVDGRIVWIETKTERGQQSDDQRRFERAMRLRGIPYEVVRHGSDVRPLIQRLRENHR